MTIDPTAQRANESGWTKEARKAEAEARRKAESAAFWAGVRAGVFAVWSFFIENLLLWLAIAGVIAIGTWEWWNSARGWRDLYPGVPFVICLIGAAGAVVLYQFAFRQWRALGRVNQPSWQWLTVTIAAYLVCGAGVSVATATSSERATRVAKESRMAYNKLVISRDDLRAIVELNDPELLKLALESDLRTLEALEHTAQTTYGMPDLDMGSGCPAPPKKFQMERLCAQANGGLDPLDGKVLEGLRIEIQRDEKRVTDSLEDVEALAKLERQVRDFHQVQGDETADAVGRLFQIEGSSALAWLLVGLSSLFLYGSGWLGDWVFERLEELRAKHRRQKGKPA